MVCPAALPRELGWCSLQPRSPTRRRRRCDRRRRARRECAALLPEAAAPCGLLRLPPQGPRLALSHSAISFFRSSIVAFIPWRSAPRTSASFFPLWEKVKVGCVCGSGGARQQAEVGVKWRRRPRRRGEGVAGLRRGACHDRDARPDDCLLELLDVDVDFDESDIGVFVRHGVEDGGDALACVTRAWWRQSSSGPGSPIFSWRDKNGCEGDWRSTRTHMDHTTSP